ncbi:MAG: MFS transporter [Chloroflexi bacterium]|nr:MFS transporter [Chloroflexota bacterium]
MQNKDRDNLRFNIFANILDGSFFGFAVGFASYSTIIPLFVATMTNSATLIGLIPAIHNMGWQLPQLLIAKRISRMDKIKPFILLITIQERIPILGLALVGLFLPIIGSTIALVFTFILLVWQGLGAGFTANAWQIMMSKVIPSDIRATFFGAQSAAANLLASIGAITAGIILVKVSPPYDFATCFLIACSLYIISWFFLKMTREPSNKADPDPEKIQPLWQNVIGILKTDLHFRNFLISRFISQFGMMSFAFYAVYAVKKLGMSNIAIGIMTSILMMTQVVANPLLGRLADKWSRKWVLVLGGIAAVASAFLAAMVKDANLFSLVFILNGIAATAFWTIGLTISLEFGDEVQRPTYVGMSNTFIAPSTILAPLLGGLLADKFGYPTTFITSGVFGLIAVFTLIKLVNDPVQDHFLPEIL